MKSQLGSSFFSKYQKDYKNQIKSPPNFNYRLYEVEFTSIYSGKKCITVPNFLINKKDGNLYELLFCNLYHILSIDKIKPYQ